MLIPSAKISPSLISRPTINGPFSIALLNYQRVYFGISLLELKEILRRNGRHSKFKALSSSSSDPLSWNASPTNQTSQGVVVNLPAIAILKNCRRFQVFGQTAPGQFRSSQF
jgi:hypothetical protein